MWTCLTLRSSNAYVPTQARSLGVNNEECIVQICLSPFESRLTKSVASPYPETSYLSSLRMSEFVAVSLALVSIIGCFCSFRGSSFGTWSTKVKLTLFTAPWLWILGNDSDPSLSVQKKTGTYSSSSGVHDCSSQVDQAQSNWDSTLNSAMDIFFWSW